MKYTDEATYVDKGKNIVFKYIKNPSITTKMKIVDDITNGVINETVGYEPILFDYFVVVAFVDNLTSIELPLSFEKSAMFIEATNINNVLREYIPTSIWDEIINATKAKIEYRKAQLLNASKLEDLFGALTNVVNKYADTFENLNIEDVLNKLSAINKIATIPNEDIVSGILKFENDKAKEDNTSE